MNVWLPFISFVHNYDRDRSIILFNLSRIVLTFLLATAGFSDKSTDKCILLTKLCIFVMYTGWGYSRNIFRNHVMVRHRQYKNFLYDLAMLQNFYMILILCPRIRDENSLRISAPIDRLYSSLSIVRYQQLMTMIHFCVLLGSYAVVTWLLYVSYIFVLYFFMATKNAIWIFSLLGTPMHPLSSNFKFPHNDTIYGKLVSK